jgi:hypothetical protein
MDFLGKLKHKVGVTGYTTRCQIPEPQSGHSKLPQDSNPAGVQRLS